MYIGFDENWEPEDGWSYCFTGHRDAQESTRLGNLARYFNHQRYNHVTPYLLPVSRTYLVNRGLLKQTDVDFNRDY